MIRVPESQICSRSVISLRCSKPASVIEVPRRIDAFDPRNVADEIERTIVDFRAGELNGAAPRIRRKAKRQPPVVPKRQSRRGGQGPEFGSLAASIRAISNQRAMTSGRMPQFQNNRLLGTGQILRQGPSPLASHLDTVGATRIRLSTETPRDFDRVIRLLRFAEVRFMTGVMEPKRLRHPLVPVAIAIGTGVFTDRCWPLSLAAWMSLAAFSAVAWAILTWRRSSAWLAGGFLLCWVLCLGGARHHLFWSIAEGDDLSLFTTDEPQLVRLSATLVDEPEIVSPTVRASRSVWAQHDTSAATLLCSSIASEERELSVSGRAALRVSGHLLHVHVGDEIEVCGWLVRPQPAHNPAPSMRPTFIDDKESAA